MEEIWKPIKGFEGKYEISNCGNVKSLDRYKIDRWKKKVLIQGCILKQNIDKYGYLHVGLYKNAKYKNCTVHRLVAEAFIPNPDNLPQVNHKDENKLNNCVDNLEWCTNEYNLNYGNRLKKAIKKRELPILQFTKNGEFITEYPSISEAAKHLKKDAGDICLCCRKKLKSAYGYIWRYASY